MVGPSIGRDEAAIVMAVGAGVQALFSGSMPPLADVITSSNPAHLAALNVTVLRAGALVGLGAVIARSRSVAIVGAVLVVAEWFVYSRAHAAALPPNATVSTVFP